VRIAETYGKHPQMTKKKKGNFKDGKTLSVVEKRGYRRLWNFLTPRRKNVMRALAEKARSVESALDSARKIISD
jgi:hypothetical protein